MNVHNSYRMTLFVILSDKIKASTKPIESTRINKTITYLGAFDVIEKILFGSKSLNINYFRVLL